MFSVPLVTREAAARLARKCWLDETILGVLGRKQFETFKHALTRAHIHTDEPTQTHTNTQLPFEYFHVSNHWQIFSSFFEYFISDFHYCHCFLHGYNYRVHHIPIFINMCTSSVLCLFIGSINCFNFILNFCDGIVVWQLWLFVYVGTLTVERQ